MVDFAIPVDNREKIKENENRDKKLDLARELKRQCTRIVRVIPNETGAF